MSSNVKTCLRRRDDRDGDADNDERLERDPLRCLLTPSCCRESLDGDSVGLRERASVKTRARGEPRLFTGDRASRGALETTRRGDRELGDCCRPLWLMLLPLSGLYTARRDASVDSGAKRRTFELGRRRLGIVVAVLVLLVLVFADAGD